MTMTLIFNKMKKAGLNVKIKSDKTFFYLYVDGKRVMKRGKK
jgi:hypothetical protein